MGLTFEVVVDQAEYSPGDEVRATMNVIEGDTARAVEATLAFHEITSDYNEVAHAVPIGIVHTGDLTGGMSIPIATVLPSDAKPNVAGPGSLEWRLDVHVDRRGFDRLESVPIAVHREAPDRPRSPSATSGPITSAGAVQRTNKTMLVTTALFVLVLLSVAAFFGVKKITTFDDPLLPSGTTVKSELEQRYADEGWIGHIMTIDTDSPDPGDLSIDTGLAHDRRGTRIAGKMCDALLDYLGDRGIEGTTVFLHSTEDAFVGGQLILGTDWICDADGLRDF